MMELPCPVSVLDLNEDEIALLFGLHAYWTPHITILPLLGIFERSRNAEEVAWMVLEGIEVAKDKRPSSNRNQVMLHVSEDRTVWIWGNLRPARLHHVLALMGVVKHSRFDEYRRGWLIRELSEGT